jgi:acetyltransferase-like isoleucine patch superfamily enzyme
VSPRALYRRLRHRLRRIRDPRRQIYYGAGPRLMSWLRKRWILFSHPHANIVFEGPVHIGPGFSLDIPHNGSLIVGPGVEFRRGFRAEIVGDAVVKIGARCVFTYYGLIQTHSPIEIGEHSGLGQSCAIFDGNHNFRDQDPNTPFYDTGFATNPIRIGRNCGILTKTTIMADVGDNSQIGANAVVTKPIPANCVAVGAPARVIDYFGPEDEAPPEIRERQASRQGN